MLFIYILCTAMILFFIAAYIVYRIAFYSSKKQKEVVYTFPRGEQYETFREPLQKAIDKILARPYEPITITAKDGTKLFGRYYHVSDGAPVQILIHGWRGYAVLDCSGGSALAQKIGHNALVIDQRANGKSGGHCISFGIREKEDCLAWIAYLIDRFGEHTQIILSGISMGASTVLMATSLELPSNVKGIMADCPFTSAKNIIQDVCKTLKIPAKPVCFFADISAFLFGHFRLAEADAVSTVARAELPILILHGEDDRFVPCHMGKTLYEANPKHIRLHTFPEAGHGLSYMVDPKRYEELVISFLNECIS